MLDAIAKLARSQAKASQDPEIPSKINQYEMAYRMQTSVPEIADIAGEPDHVLDLYGPDVKKPGTFARNCLLARRLAERDVRYTMVVHMGWDHHGGIAARLPASCREVDQPSAGLIADLKQRGLLDDTLVVFSTEFGRTSFAQGTLKTNFGRDHHGGNFCVFMAGAGVKAGLHLRRDRRLRLQHRQGPGTHPRSERDDPAHHGHRSPEAHLPVAGSRLPAHRRPRQRGEGRAHVALAPRGFCSASAVHNTSVRLQADSASPAKATTYYRKLL